MTLQAKLILISSSHQVVNNKASDKVTVSAPLGEINVHIRSGSILLIHSEPQYTLAETKDGPYGLVVALDKYGEAKGEAIIDDGVSLPGEQIALFAILVCDTDVPCSAHSD